MLPIDFDPGNPLWKNELAPFDLTAERIGEEIRPLLEISQHITFVDRNTNIIIAKSNDMKITDTKAVIYIKNVSIIAPTCDLENLF